jgi:hypothetical protein
VFLTYHSNKIKTLKVTIRKSPARGFFVGVNNSMRYVDKQFNQIPCPYGIHFLDQYTDNKTATIMPIAEYCSDLTILRQVDVVILYEWSGIIQVPENLPSNCYVLYYDFKNKFANTFYYPQWLFFVADILDKFLDVTTTYPLACASRNFNNNRSGKIYNYQQLKNKTYFNDILITKYKSIEPFDMDTIPLSIVDDFINDYNTWPSMLDDGLDLISSMSVIDIPVYRNSLFHLVAETSIEHYQLSEKIFKTFLAGQIPIMCGPQNSVAHLRDLGFDMFDDIIDHNRYDSISDWKQRINTMHTCIDDIISLDHNSIKQLTLTRRLHNFNLLRSRDFHKTLLEPIAQQFS